MYDLNRHEDRFLLGVLGTVSESEIHTLRMRMHAGWREPRRIRARAVRGLAPGVCRRRMRTDAWRRTLTRPGPTKECCVRNWCSSRFAACALAVGSAQASNGRGVRCELPHRGSKSLATRGQLIWRPAKPCIRFTGCCAAATVYAHGRFVRWGREKPNGSGIPGWRHEDPRSSSAAYIGWDIYELNQKQLSANVFHARTLQPG